MIQWKALEHSYHEKDISWYWLVIIFAILIAALAIWQGNFLFAVFTVIAAVTVIAWGKREPDLIDFELDNDGLKIGNKFYPKENFNHFSIKITGSEWDKLLLKKKSKLSQPLWLPIPHFEFDNIKKYCLNFWTEEEYKESLLDVLSDYFRF